MARCLQTLADIGTNCCRHVMSQCVNAVFFKWHHGWRLAYSFISFMILVIFNFIISRFLGSCQYKAKWSVKMHVYELSNWWLWRFLFATNNMLTRMNTQRTHTQVWFSSPIYTITLSNGNIFRVAVLLCGPRVAWMNGWVNNREAGDLVVDLIRCRAHYDVAVMIKHLMAYDVLLRTLLWIIVT